VAVSASTTFDNSAGNGALALNAATKNSIVERVDFGVTRRSTSPTYDASLAPASDAAIKEFVIPITHDTIEIAKGVRYQGWTFGGTVPGPVIRVKVGDTVRVHLKNPADSKLSNEPVTQLESKNVEAAFVKCLAGPEAMLDPEMSNMTSTVRRLYEVMHEPALAPGATQGR